jgi:LysM repeat protein
LSDDKYRGSLNSEGQIPAPPRECDGQFYTVKASDTLFNIAKKFGVTVRQIVDANPQIENPDIIFAGQVICIPTGRPRPTPTPTPTPRPTPTPTPTPAPDGRQLRVLSLRLLSETGQPLPRADGAVQLDGRVIVRATFNRPVSRAFFFLEPTGTEACENARLIGIDCPSAVTGVAEILWRVPSGTLGRVFVVACLDSICTKSSEVLVVRNS